MDAWIRTPTPHPPKKTLGKNFATCGKPVHPYPFSVILVRWSRCGALFRSRRGLVCVCTSLSVYVTFFFRRSFALAATCLLGWIAATMITSRLPLILLWHPGRLISGIDSLRYVDLCSATSAYTAPRQGQAAARPDGSVYVVMANVSILVAAATVGAPTPSSRRRSFLSLLLLFSFFSEKDRKILSDWEEKIISVFHKFYLYISPSN